MVQVRLLGPVDVVDDLGTVHSPGSALRRALLALFALHATKVLTADWLMENVWAGEPPESGRRALRFHISQLRKELGDVDLIETRPGGYRLMLAAEQVDALAIDLAARNARQQGDRSLAADMYAEVLNTWRGEPFVDAAPCAVLDDEAQRLTELHITLTEEYLQSRLDGGAGRELIADLSRETTKHQLRESLWAMLITVQYRAGLQADALRSYEQMRSLLAESLGLDPSNELQDLQRRVLQQDPDLLHSVPPSDPAPVIGLNGPGRRLPATKELIGRREMVDDLVARLDTSRLITLVGPGGVGKTSMAVSVAAARSARHRDASWFVDLSRVSSGELVATAIGSALGMHAGEHGLHIDDVVELLLDKSLLIVTDNCEHVVDEAAIAIDSITSNCPDVHILATSREALGLLDEETVRVPTLDDDSALALLRRRASRVDAAPFSAAEEELAATLCRTVDRLPLGIELIAGRLHAMSVAEILRQLEAGALLHVDAQRGSNVRHRSLHSTVEWSYQLLPEAGKQLLRRLAVFQGGAHLDAIVAVCSDRATGQDGRAITELINTLVSTSLVSIERVDGRTRYRLLETVRAFAAELLEGAENDEIRARHVREMINWALQMRHIAEGMDPAPAFTAIHTESGNLRAAVDWCKVGGDHASILELVGSIGPFLARYAGAIPEIEEWVELALAVEGADPALRVDALLVGAFAAAQPDEVEYERASEALRLAAPLGDPRVVAFAEFAVGDVRIDGDAATIDVNLRTSIDVAEAALLFPIAGGAVNTLANLLIRQLRYDEAAGLLVPRIANSARYGTWEPFILYQHARCALLQGELADAEAGFDAAMRAGERVAAPMGVGYAWFGKGLLAEAAGDLAAARVCIERSLAIDEQINDRHEVLNDRLKLLTVCLELGDLDTARAQGRLMSELAAFCPGSREVGGREQAYGLLAIADGRPDAARTHLLGALQAFAPTQMVDIFLHTLGMFAGIVTPSAATRLAELANEVRTQRLPMLEAVEIVQDVLDL